MVVMRTSVEDERRGLLLEAMPLQEEGEEVMFYKSRDNKFEVIRKCEEELLTQEVLGVSLEELKELSDFDRFVKTPHR